MNNSKKVKLIKHYENQLADAYKEYQKWRRAKIRTLEKLEEGLRSSLREEVLHLEKMIRLLRSKP